MSRTTAKKAASVNEKDATANLSVSFRKEPKGITLNNQLKRSKDEKRFQTGLERMQLAIENNKFDLPTILKKASDQLDRIKSVENQLKILGKEPVSDYSKLKEIFLSDLAGLKADAFLAEAMISARKWVSLAKGAVSEKQESVITQYYLGQAKVKGNIVNEVYDLLVHKGQIKARKETPAPAPAPVNNNAEKVLENENA